MYFLLKRLFYLFPFLFWQMRKNLTLWINFLRKVSAHLTIWLEYSKRENCISMGHWLQTQQQKVLYLLAQLIKKAITTLWSTLHVLEGLL
jgi:hypothetical protein